MPLPLEWYQTQLKKMSKQLPILKREVLDCELSIEWLKWKMKHIKKKKRSSRRDSIKENVRRSFTPRGEALA